MFNKTRVILEFHLDLILQRSSQLFHRIHSDAAIQLPNFSLESDYATQLKDHRRAIQGPTMNRHRPWTIIANTFVLCSGTIEFHSSLGRMSNFTEYANDTNKRYCISSRYRGNLCSCQCSIRQCLLFVILHKEEEGGGRIWKMDNNRLPQ